MTLPFSHWLVSLLRRTAGGQVGKRLIGRLFSWGVMYMSFAIPVKRLRETPSVLAFMHPQPAYPLHILLVPRRSIASFGALAPQDADVLQELVQTAQSLVQEYELEKYGYRLIINGGPNQDFPHLHVHLVSNSYPAESTSGS